MIMRYTNLLFTYLLTYYDQKTGPDKEPSCCREAARRSVSLKILLSLKVIRYTVEENHM